MTELAPQTQQLPAPIEPSPPPHDSRWRLVRDLIVFQVKLVVDGLKDLVLGPTSMIAGVIDLARGTPRERGLFMAVLRAGDGFDRWVGLFDALAPRERSEAPASLDDHLRRVEQVLIEQHQRGGLTADAKLAIDRALDVLEGRFKPGPPPTGPSDGGG